MSALQTIDSLRFARSGEQMSGVFLRSDLPRLSDILAPHVDEVKFHLTGSVESGRPVLKLRLETAVSLVCQRCLAEYEELIEIDCSYPLAKNDEQLALWESTDPLIDVLMSSPKFLVAEFVEDEILLGLPSAPRHPEGMCDTEVQAYLQ
jgi:uncharacterized protein